MDEVVSLQGPVEEQNGRLVLLIPLEAGGSILLRSAHGIAEIEGQFLKVNIPDWLATRLRIQNGSIVAVNNANGKFNIVPMKESD